MLAEPSAAKLASAGAVEVIDAVARETLATQIAALPAESVLVKAGEMTVLLARAHQIPNALREIARLREVTFRAAGEGTNRAMDLDWFDRHYLHLFLWNAAEREIVGAYRLAPSDEILPSLGPRGFYSRTLFA